MMRPLALKKITPQEASFFQKIFCYPYKMSFLKGEKEFVFKFEPVGDLPYPNLLAQFEISGHTVNMMVDQLALKLADKTLEGVDWSSLPNDVLRALGESYLEIITQRLEKELGKTVRLTEVSFDATPQIETGQLSVGFQIIRQRDGARVRGILWGNEGLASFLLDIVSLMEQEETKQMVELPICLRIVLGKTYLPVSELNSIEKSDIILVDEFYLKENKRVILDVSKGLKFWATLDDNRVIVEKTLEEENMKEETIEQQQENLNKVDDIPVELSFELGTLTINLAQLSAIQPGYVFELNKNLETPVDIKANGKLIGRGELLDIDGRIGVRVVEFSK